MWNRVVLVTLTIKQTIIKQLFGTFVSSATLNFCSWLDNPSGPKPPHC